ncbi:MAG: DNA-3-methyladenine glycosylase I, partial [Flavobacteriaceae bacterium]
MQKNRCGWCAGNPLYEQYHDQEWGIPIFDDQLLFEFLTLETFQAGLSWITILRKRQNFKKAFDNFDCHKIAAYSVKKEEDLLSNAGIIRNRLKINAAIKNARAFIEIQKTNGSFANYIWDFVSGQPIVNHFKTSEDVPV